MHRGWTLQLDQRLDADVIAPAVERVLEGADIECMRKLGLRSLHATGLSRSGKRKHNRQSDLLPDGQAWGLEDVFGVTEHSSDTSGVTRNGERHRARMPEKKSKKLTGFGPWPREEPAEPPKRVRKRGVAHAPWPAKGLLVRVVDEAGDWRDHHLSKGVVRGVDTSGLCLIELHSKSTLKAVPQTCLETVVSKTCKRIEIVRGEHRGLQAPLLFRDPKNNSALVQVGMLGGDESQNLTVALDDVCEYEQSVA